MNMRPVDVLLVDDDANDAELSLRALRQPQLDLTAMWVTDGRLALELLNTWALSHSLPKVMFLDLHMSGLDGMAVLQQLRSTTALRCIPVVIFSSSDDPGDIRNCYERGANSYVIKPIEPARFNSTLHTAASFWVRCNQITFNT